MICEWSSGPYKWRALETLRCSRSQSELSFLLVSQIEKVTGNFKGYKKYEKVFNCPSEAMGFKTCLSKFHWSCNLIVLPLSLHINKLTSVFFCVCPLIDDKLHHNIVKVAVETWPAGEFCTSFIFDIMRQHIDHCDDAYSLSIREQTTLNHIQFVWNLVTGSLDHVPRTCAETVWVLHCTRQRTATELVLYSLCCCYRIYFCHC